MKKRRSKRISSTRKKRKNNIKNSSDEDVPLLERAMKIRKIVSIKKLLQTHFISMKRIIKAPSSEFWPLGLQQLD